MEPEKIKISTKAHKPVSWKKLLNQLNKYRQALWLVFLLSSLVSFIIWIPPPVRRLLWEALAAEGVLSGMLLAFGLVSISLVWSTGQRLDVSAFLIFNLRGKRPAWLDWMMLGLTQLGNGITALIIGLLFFLADARLLAYVLILGALMLWIVVELIKVLVRRSRPFVRVLETRIVGGRAGGRSFPSGHTSQAFFLATILAPQFDGSLWVTLLLYAAALVVSITRMYVGVHYPRDVLAGAILGSTWGALGVLVYGHMNGLI